jgi:hypothetical protein
VPLWPWEDADEPRFPSIGRVQTTTPETLTAIRRRIKVRPFGLFLEGHTRRRGDAAPIALDPGTDLAEWQSLDWRNGDGGPAHVDANLLDNLGGKAHQWLQPRRLDDQFEVVVVPELIRRVGKAGGVIEANLVVPDADTSGVRAVYDEGDAAGFVAWHAAEIGPRAFARTAVVSKRAAQRLKDGKPVQAATIRHFATSGSALPRPPSARSTGDPCSVPALGTARRGARPPRRSVASGNAPMRRAGRRPHHDPTTDLCGAPDRDLQHRPRT